MFQKDEGKKKKKNLLFFGPANIFESTLAQNIT
jgi:hypothetical protein